MLTHHQFVLEIPSVLAHPLAPIILIKSVSLDATDTTWKLASDDLWAVIDSMGVVGAKYSLFTRPLS